MNCANILCVDYDSRSPHGCTRWNPTGIAVCWARRKHLTTKKDAVATNPAGMAGSTALMKELKMEMVTIINREMMSDYQTLVGADKRFVTEWIRDFFDNKITGIELSG